ncbi:hypothetical protein PtA15_7A341 [Puccinia triticina]|uniref:F-BAR domain-containing protein n=1 Tax=Puccinia triticina TaxID=208348 RepID=A0ABY7CS78_9BASI|nr:uncharacterized protein PtA15_7A341 [Puccinia triticina]WAQ86615.1 hypothetical protein PtA15_7A341 [Puccinia triticina]WAR56476.1 hypothetical protein PtB15_7B325 [Puccinia triticina]
MARLANLFNKVHLQFPQAEHHHDKHPDPPSPQAQRPDYYPSPGNHIHRPQGAHDCGYQDSMQDFCNAFWGDAGYEVLMSRVKQSSRMLEDLKTWYKERSAIELEYSKKLFRLSKSPVLASAAANLEPIGLKSALDSIRISTEKSAHCHAELSGTFKTALYEKFAAFISTRDSVKKNPQATVEKLRKILVDLQAMHEKARRRFESDSIAKNGYVTQLQLVQGRDSDKVSNKLDKVHMSIKITEKEYRTHNKNFQETINEWNTQWKLFCDLIQDLEEDRIDFVRNTFWDYANAVSAICVAEDEQCECIRQSLERCDASKDVRSYVRQAATGNEYTLAPCFVDYTAGEIPRPVAVLAANFIRTSTRKPEDTTLVPLSKPLQGMVQSIKAGPPLPPEAHGPNGKNASTAWENKNKIKRGGVIAEAVASMSLNNIQNVNPNPPERNTDLTADNLDHLQRIIGHSHTQPGLVYPSDRPSNEQPPNPYRSPQYAHPVAYHQPHNHPSLDGGHIAAQNSQSIYEGNNKKSLPLTPINLNDRPLPPPPI